MIITVFGGGPGAVSVAYQAKKNFEDSEVYLLEPSPGKISQDLVLFLPDGSTSHLKGINVTHETTKIIPQTHILLLSNPYNTYPEFLKTIVPLVSDKLKLVCALPGASMFDLMVRQAFSGYQRNFAVGAVESLPTIAKRVGEKKVNIYAYKERLNLALNDQERVSDISMEKLIGSQFNYLKNFLTLSLLNPGAKVNPLLFLEAVNRIGVEDNRVSAYELSEDLDKRLSGIESEIEVLRRSISAETGVDLSGVKTVRDWLVDCYPTDISDKSTASSCLRTNRFYLNLKPDFTVGIGESDDKRKSRYLTEQIPYGLVSFKSLAEIFGVSTPMIDSVIKDCEPYLGKHYIQNGRLINDIVDTSSVRRFGIIVPSQLSRLYTPKTSGLALEKKEFHENGFTFMGKILPQAILKELEKKVGEAIKTAPEKDTNQSLLNLHWKDDWFLEFCSKKELVEIACHLLEEKRVKIFSSLIVSKAAQSKMWVPWHQDAAYDWPLKPVDCASIWIALDDVTPDNGPMIFAKGGHKKIFPMEITPEQKNGEYFFAEQLKQSIPPEKLEGFDMVPVTMNKGECSFHHIMTPHTSHMNKTNIRRAAFVVRYCKEKAFLETYPGMPREEFFMNYKLFEIKQTSA